MHYELKLRRRELRENSQKNESQSSQSGQRSLSQGSQNGQRSLSQGSQSEHGTEVEEHSSVIQHEEPDSEEPQEEIIDIIQVRERDLRIMVDTTQAFELINLMCFSNTWNWRYSAKRMMHGRKRSRRRGSRSWKDSWRKQTR